MQRECNGDDLVEDDNDGEASRPHKTEKGDEFYACDLGMRYPALQVASHREDLHVRIKVSNACISLHKFRPRLSTSVHISPLH